MTTGLFGSKQSFVPVGHASPSGDGVRVPFEKGTVNDAPKVDPDGRLSLADERELYSHCPGGGIANDVPAIRSLGTSRSLRANRVPEHPLHDPETRT